MVTGKVVRYEVGRGYGFIAPDHGGDDVFVHASDLEASKEDISCGTRVEFKVVDGGRGLKAYDVRLLREGGPAPAPVEDQPESPVRTAAPAADLDLSDGLCEVLSEREFVQEITELVLASSPSTTAAQVLEIRRGLIGVARKHGWVD